MNVDSSHEGGGPRRGIDPAAFRCDGNVMGRGFAGPREAYPTQPAFSRFASPFLTLPYLPRLMSEAALGDTRKGTCFDDPDGDFFAGMDLGKDTDREIQILPPPPSPWGR